VRVDLYNSAAATEATDKTAKASSDKALAASKQTTAKQADTEDKTTLSSSSDSVQSLTKTALQTTPSRAAKVEALKLAVNSAQYQLDAAKIAESLSSADL
jgi:flagellar biosynthesis anti-sigma factor FlgM